MNACIGIQQLSINNRICILKKNNKKKVSKYIKKGCKEEEI